MTTFNFTGGDPDHLVGGQSAFMSDIQGSFVDLKTFLNAGTMDETNVPNLAAAFTTYKTIGWAGAALNSAIVTGSGVYMLWFGFPGNAGTQNSPGTVGGAASAACAFHVDPTDWQANTRLNKFRLKVQYLTNAVASGMSPTVGLYQATAFGGASGSNPTVSATSVVIAGTTVAFTLPTGATNNIGVSGDFNAPSSGMYVVGVQTSGAMNAGATALVSVQLQMRQV